tara:strand:+ start:1279 stop:2373 length:1095 start_codon:yes stop_codon:yes gene_type:complete
MHFSIITLKFIDQGKAKKLGLEQVVTSLKKCLSCKLLAIIKSSPSPFLLGLDPLLENEWKSFMRIVRFLLFLLITPLSFSKDKPLFYAPEIPKPTLSEIRYGKHERNLLDFWKAESTKPTPLVFVIHGGGWKGGSKERLSKFADANLLLQAGISVVAINYRFVTDLESPPVKAPLHDAARALKFVRSKAKEWNIDKNRVGAAGGSAGACTSLWLAFHDDLANPESKDSVERESTRLSCAAVTGAQTTLDPKQMKEWTPNSKYGGHAFGLRNFSEFLAKRDKIMPWIKEYSPYANVSPDDPSVYLIYSKGPALGKEQKDPTHTSNFGVKLQEHCKSKGVSCELVYPGAPEVSFANPTEFLVSQLK